MSLRDRLSSIDASATVVGTMAKRPGGVTARSVQDLKMRMHQLILDRINLTAMQNLPEEQVKEELKHLVEKLLQEEDVVINDLERKTLVRDVQYEMLGYGPLEPLLADPSVSDILINTHKQVFIETKGKLVETDIQFDSDAHLMRILDKIVSRVGRRIDESSPMVDARLPDGSRVNAIIPPLAIDGPIISIRRFAKIPLTMENIINNKSITPDMAQLLEGVAKAKLNVLISGGTGGGKTTLLNILSGYINKDERIVTIEDAAELQLQQPHVIRLETRPPSIEGKGEVSQRALVRNALRMRPDRIILGEVRGEEAFDMLQAMNTGHEGSMATVHANTARDAISRLENMLGMANSNMPVRAMRSQISSAISVVVQIARLTDGRRIIASIYEITGMEGDIITMQEIFGFKQAGTGADGKIQGHFAASGVRPQFTERLRSHGVVLPDKMFDPSRRFE
jgi:pilus assembly protein CpaF